MKLEKYLSERRREINRALERYLIGSDGVSPELGDAIRYAVFPGGKRLRPILTLACAEVLGAEPQKALPAACAIEFIHSYSLIHDDLPCMDNDDIRRGRPTLHRVFGEALALLAGDALIPLAFEVIACEEDEELLPQTRVALLAEIARASGARAMVGGQALDIAALRGNVSTNWEAGGPDALRRIATLKTGRLIQAACRCGAIVAGASEETLERMGRYGLDLGLAFQIADDILDFVKDASGAAMPGVRVPGKGTGGVAIPTYPGVYGIDESRRMVRSLIAEAKGEVAFLGERAWVLLALADKVMARAEGVGD